MFFHTSVSRPFTKRVSCSNGLPSGEQRAWSTRSKGTSLLLLTSPLKSSGGLFLTTDVEAAFELITVCYLRGGVAAMGRGLGGCRGEKGNPAPLTVLYGMAWADVGCQ